jgi:hypothetical protein
MKTLNIPSILILMLLTFTSMAQLRVLNNGNTGVGTTTPLARLHVQGGQILINNSSGTNRPLTLSGGGDAIFKQGDSGGWTFGFHAKGSLGTDRGGFGFSGSGNTLSYYYIGQSFTNPTITVLPATKRVGIGTLSPETALAVNGQIKAMEQIHIGSNINEVGGRGLTIDHGGSHAWDFITCTNTKANLKITRFKVFGSGDVAIKAGSTFGYDLYVNGTIYGTNIWTRSDRRLKRNIRNIDNALDKVKRIEGKTYDFIDHENNPFLRGRQYGFIAQDLETVLPEAVKIDSSGFYAVNISALIPVLVESIKELSFKQDSLTRVITACCRNGNGKKSIGNVQGENEAGFSLENQEGAVLYQNIPNPFNQQTSIKYQLPNLYSEASIMIFDLQGKMIKSYPLTQSGSGSLIINGFELHPGMFVYSLLVDGKLVDTKRMILTN